MEEAIIFTDGSTDNARNGGWAAIVHTPMWVLEVSGYEQDTTNNRMEMLAAIRGLEELSQPTMVDLVSDSAYLLNTIKGQWHQRWVRDRAFFQEWDKEYDRPNMDLWEEIMALEKIHEITPVKIKGHSGDYWNEFADRAAVLARYSKAGDRAFLKPESRDMRFAQKVGAIKKYGG